MSLPVVIAPLTPEWSPQLAAIDRLSNSPPWPAHLFEGEFNNPHALLIGARLGGELKGFVVAHHVLDQGHILNLAVAPEVRGAGVGRAILEHLFSELFELGVLKVHLEVRISNFAALSLYDSFGFYRTAVKERYYSDNGEDAIFMSADLTQSLGQFGS